MTPVCPHTLSFRPVILPDSVELELRVPQSARSTAWVSFDGKNRQELTRGDKVFVRMSEFPIPTVRLARERAKGRFPVWKAASSIPFLRRGI